MQQVIHRHRILGLLIVLMLPLLPFAATTGENPQPAVSNSTIVLSYIVQASSADAARNLVVRSGGTVTATLNIIDAVGAELTEQQTEWLRSQAERIRIYHDGTLEISAAKSGLPKPKKNRDTGAPGPAPDPGRAPPADNEPGLPAEPDGPDSEPAIETYYPTLVGAAELHEQGIKGDGVTIAVLDTGLWKSSVTEFTADGRARVVAQYDATTGGGYDGDIDDWNGHGTHITSIMMSSGRTEVGRYQGIAPNASVVAVRAFEADGSGTYLNVIKALDWIVSHRKKYGIRILNLSFGAPPASHYWEDPVNQAVMAAWKSGIIVVAAAGNGGPDPMTVGVPGNVPYVITVGAMTDNFTPENRTDDKITTFSAAGPTFEGFVKPELLAPGGHMLGQMPPYAWLPLEHPEFVHQDNDYFTMSGTSQATAVVSGVLALLLQVEPKLKPDQAKCRVMASARFAMRDDGTPAYSVFQQGAGLVDAVAAISETVVDCANRNMDIKNELKDKAHFAGPSGVDESGTYYLVNDLGVRLPGPGYEWSQGSLWRGGASWQQGPFWNQGRLWGQGKLWGQGNLWGQGKLWGQGELWGQGKLWGQGELGNDILARPVSINTWVDAE